MKVKIAKSFIYILLILMITVEAQSWSSLQLSGITTYNKEKAYKGYTCFLSMVNGTIFCIDMRGYILQSWDTNGIRLPELAKFLPNGNILVGRTPLTEYSWTGEILWTLDDPKLNHDFYLLDNGNYLVVSEENVIEPLISDREIQDDIIYEINPNKEIVWIWRSRDHYEEFGLSDEEKDFIYKRGGKYLSINSIQPLPRNPFVNDQRFVPGNIIISYRHINTIIIIDRQTGAVMWKLGPDYSELDDLGQVIGQHNAHMIPLGLPGEGNILFFDNGYTVGYSVENRCKSRIVELNPKTMKKVWQYPKDTKNSYQFFSYFISGVQRLPNSNTFITEGMDGRIFEVTREGEIVWEFVDPNINVTTGRSLVYRATKYPVDYFIYDFVLSERDIQMNNQLRNMRYAVEALKYLKDKYNKILYGF